MIPSAPIIMGSDQLRTTTVPGSDTSHGLRVGMDLATGEILDGSSASGYPVNISIFQALCPSKVPINTE
jgi:hypothetical protein